MRFLVVLFSLLATLPVVGMADEKVLLTCDGILAQGITRVELRYNGTQEFIRVVATDLQGRQIQVSSSRFGDDYRSHFDENSYLIFQEDLRARPQPYRQITLESSTIHLEYRDVDGEDQSASGKQWYYHTRVWGYDQESSRAKYRVIRQRLNSVSCSSPQIN
jgi:hypothetical protein